MRARASGALVAIGTVALALAGCGPQSTTPPSPEPGATSALASPVETVLPAGSGGPASPAASAAPSASPAPAARPIQPGVAAVVLVGLNVRQYPTTSAAKIGSLAKGDVIYLYGFGGIKAGGYTWFQMGRIHGLRGSLPPLPAWPIQGNWTDETGWIAIGSAATPSTPWISALEPRCSAEASTNLTILSAMLPGEELECLGQTPLLLHGTFGCSGCGGDFPGTFTPTWLASPLTGLFSANYAKQIGPLQLHFPPGMTHPADGMILDVHGHFDDARSSDCKVAIPTSEDLLAKPVPIRSADARAWCRERLVVDSYTVLGADPSYPPS